MSEPRGDVLKPAISLCVCTANRPEVLRGCLRSVAASEELPLEVVVGDDSAESGATRAVCDEFPFVSYVRGPRRGLCANRNRVIAAARGQFVSLLDDDGEVSPAFFRVARALAAGSDGRTIFTGDVLEHRTERIAPSNPTFWGHFGGPMEAGACETVHLNCNLFPRCAFEAACFDESIRYGYEDMDLCAQLLAAGFRIEYRPELVNHHLPPPKDAVTRGAQRKQQEQARFYTSLKRYLLWQRRPARFAAYLALAPLHQAAHHAARREPRAAAAAFADMGWAIARLLRLLARRQPSV